MVVVQAPAKIKGLIVHFSVNPSIFKKSNHKRSRSEEKEIIKEKGIKRK